MKATIPRIAPLPIVDTAPIGSLLSHPKLADRNDFRILRARIHFGILLSALAVDSHRRVSMSR